VHRTHTKTKNETNLVNDMQMFSPKATEGTGTARVTLTRASATSAVIPSYRTRPSSTTSPRHATQNPGSRGHIRSVPDPPRVLPTLVPGDDEDPEVDPWEVLDMSLPLDTLIMMQRQGISVQDVLDGKVPGLDPDEIVAKAMEETGSYTGPWTPFAF
jgi:hypothetical protein